MSAPLLRGPACACSSPALAMQQGRTFAAGRGTWEPAPMLLIRPHQGALSGSHIPQDALMAQWEWSLHMSRRIPRRRIHFRRTRPDCCPVCGYARNHLWCPVCNGAGVHLATYQLSRWPAIPSGRERRIRRRHAPQSFRPITAAYCLNDNVGRISTDLGLGLYPGGPMPRPFFVRRLPGSVLLGAPLPSRKPGD